MFWVRKALHTQVEARPSDAVGTLSIGSRNWYRQVVKRYCRPLSIAQLSARVTEGRRLVAQDVAATDHIELYVLLLLTSTFHFT